MDLFASMAPKTHLPLPERLRPRQFAEFFGQSHLRVQLSRYLKVIKQAPISLILYGPPGTGKSSFAKLLGDESGAHVEALNAVDCGAKQLKDIAQQAKFDRTAMGKITLVLIDEIHRLNKSQQDVLLPFVEAGDFFLIGTTTENPKVSINWALQSRCQILHFKRLEKTAMKSILQTHAEELVANPMQVFSLEAIDYLIDWSDGDARRFLNTIDWLLQDLSENLPSQLSAKDLSEHLKILDSGRGVTTEDKYNLISAFIKSVRGSDPNASIYYLARLLEGGEDPMYVARRLVILASEDIGNAEPTGLPLAIAGLQAVQNVGLPEAAICLAQVTTFLASAPKSNRAYKAWNLAKAEVAKSGKLPVPSYLQSLQDKSTYKYPHDDPRGWLPQHYLPEAIRDKQFYQPSAHGAEERVFDWLKKDQSE